MATRIPIVTGTILDAALNDAVEELRGAAPADGDSLAELNAKVAGRATPAQITAAVAEQATADKATSDALAARVLPLETALPTLETQAHAAVTYGTPMATALAARRSDAFRRTFAPPPALDMPVVTAPTQATAPVVTGSTLTRAAPSGQPADMAAHPAFRFDGTDALVSAFTDYVGPGTLPGSASQKPPYAIETLTPTANSTVGFLFRARNADLRYRVTVNGQPMSLATESITAVSGELYVLTLTFPVARARHVRVEVLGEHHFGGCYATTGQTLARPTSPLTKRVVIVSDSFDGGAYAVPNGAGPLETGAYLAAKLLGADSIWNLGIGGSGYTTAVTYQQRAGMAAAASPHILIVHGSTNDGNASTATLTTAVQTFLASVSAVPAVYVTGPELLTIGAVNYATRGAAIQAAAVAAGRVYLDALVEPWLDPAKHLSTVDNLHPNWLGQQRRGSRLAEGILLGTAP